MARKYVDTDLQPRGKSKPVGDIFAPMPKRKAVTQPRRYSKAETAQWESIKKGREALPSYGQHRRVMPRTIRKGR